MKTGRENFFKIQNNPNIGAICSTLVFTAAPSRGDPAHHSAVKTELHTGFSRIKQVKIDIPPDRTGTKLIKPSSCMPKRLQRVDFRPAE